MGRIIYTWLLCICFFPLLSQDVEFLDDSLQQIIDRSDDPLVQSDCYNRRGYMTLDGGNKLAARDFFDKADSISRKFNYRKGLAFAKFNEGLKAWEQNKIVDAEALMIASITSLDELKVPLDLYTPLSAIRLFYNETQQYERKLKFYQSKLEYYRKIKNEHNTGSCYHGIANYYNISGFSEKSIEFYLKAMEVWNHTGNTTCAGAMQIVVAIQYGEWGNKAYAAKFMDRYRSYPTKTMPFVDYVIYKRSAAQFALDSGKYEIARDHYLSLIKYNDKIGEVNSLINYIQIARAYFLMGRADSAKYYVDLVLPHILEKHYSIWNANGDLEYEYYAGRYFWLTGNKPEGFRLFQSALASAKAEHYNKLVLKYLKELAAYARELGQPEMALNYLTEYNLLSDSLDEASQGRRISLYETELKEKEINLLNKDNAIKQAQISRQKIVRNGLMAGFAVVLIFAVIFFRQRNKIRTGKQRSDELLLNILPEEVAEELKQNGKAEARQFDQVTVLFTDFKNFTTLSSHLSAADLVNEINYCYCHFDRIIADHGIEKIKTIGDSYMCVGGLPVPDPEHAIKTVKAALAIRDFMVEEKLLREQKGQTFFEIRIGLHSGPVVAGIVGIKKFAYDIWGDTVNIASRMESCGQTGKVNVSEATCRLIQDQFDCLHRGKIEAKNKGEIDMYFVEKK